MPKFRYQDMHYLENTPTSPGTISHKMGELFANSTVCRAKVESINSDTGEYRIIFHGTLDNEESKFNY